MALSEAALQETLTREFIASLAPSPHAPKSRDAPVWKLLLKLPLKSSEVFSYFGYRTSSVAG